MARGALLAGLAALAVGCSPYGGGAFTCATDDQCGANGKCEADHYCAFSDVTCPSGYKYGEASGPSSNQCVGGNGDGGVGSDGSGSDGGSNCFGTLNVCLQTAPSGTLPFDSQTPINTDTSNMCAPLAGGATAWCVLAAQTITIGSTGSIIATGTKPLVLVATGMITVSGTIDVASHRTPSESIGAGADPSACVAGSTPGANGGGAGGSFGGMGGNGGDPNKSTASAAQTPATLRGGCPGTNGMSGGTIGKGGHGGGAVYLYAGQSISISGAIDASGESGTVGTPSNAGGGGGGSGGMISLDSPMITVVGVVFANGAGASSGTGGSTAGSSGTDPVVTSANMPAPGGMGPTTNGGPGGPGSAAAMKNGGMGMNGMSGGGGGGGGGAAGVIVIHGTKGGTGVVSPPAS